MYSIAVKASILWIESNHSLKYCYWTASASIERFILSRKKCLVDYQLEGDVHTTQHHIICVPVSIFENSVDLGSNFFK